MWNLLDFYFHAVRSPMGILGYVLGAQPKAIVYQDFYDRMQIGADWVLPGQKAARRIFDNMDRYKNVSHETKLPWEFIGIIHHMESFCNFNTHLHNGDPLTARTVHVPKGRPVGSNPPFLWEYSAMDALNNSNIVKPMSGVGDILKAMEAYNGLGYRKRGINTPYVWSGSTYYTKGKYSADGVYDPELISKQCGGAVVYYYLSKLTKL